MGRKKKCPYDCFSCPYEDCIAGNKSEISQKQYQKEYRKQNEERLKLLQKQWHQANRETQTIKNRQKWQIKVNEKRNTCCQCGLKYRKSREVIKYGRKYFCSYDCLGKFLVEKAREKDLLKFEMYIAKGEEG